MTLRIGLIGAGRIGKVHASAIGGTVGATLVSVADAVPAAAQAVADEHGCAVQTVETILHSGDIDAVFITAPTDTHAELIIAAAKASKAIFCEKPIDLSADRTRDCLAVVAHHQTPLMVGFNRRFDPNFRAVRTRIDDGSIGSVEMVNITSRDPAPPPYGYVERSGGLFRDMTIHDFDMARFLLGEEPVTVSALGTIQVDQNIAKYNDIDTAAITLVTESGKIAQISNSRRATFGYDQRVEVLGSLGMARAENIHESTVEVADATGYRRPPLMNFFVARYMDSYRAEVASFVDAIHSGSPCIPSGDDGLRALLLADAAMQSLADGRVITVEGS